MNFYVPEIGDTLQLTRSWRFSLYAEGRNAGLGAYYGHVTPLYRGIWVEGEENIEKVRQLEYPRVPNKDFYPNGNTRDYQNFDRKGYNEAVKAAIELYKYQLNQLGRESLEVEFPIGTILSIERIYIRRGASQFSSISFYVKNLENSGKGKRPKALRFWAKLSDCNNIEFEKIEKEEKK